MQTTRFSTSRLVALVPGPIPAGGSATVTIRSDSRGPLFVRKMYAQAETAVAIDSTPAGTVLPNRAGPEAAANTMPNLAKVTANLNINNQDIDQEPVSLAVYGDTGVLMYELMTVEQIQPDSQVKVTFTNNNAVAIQNVRLELHGTFSPPPGM